MANAVYPLFKQSLITEADANKSLNQTGSNAPYASLVTISSGYVYSASHQFYSSLTNIVGTPQPITTPTVVNGTFDGDDVTFTAVSGTVVGAIVIYRQNAGANTTWRLVLYEDTSVTGLPVTPNGGNIVITWNASGIFTLSDSEAKRDVRRVAQLPDGLPLYSWRYRGSGRRAIGVMAQDVAQHYRAAVGRVGRFRAVNYDHVLRRALHG
jgi:endosialidase-like protein